MSELLRVEGLSKSFAMGDSQIDVLSGIDLSVQHGERNAKANEIRAGGFAVANVFASMEPGPFVGADADLALLDQLLMERFLIRIDDGSQDRHGPRR